MIRKQIFPLAVLAAAVAFPQFSIAQEDKPKEKTPEDVFKELDKNADGKLTSGEISEERKRFFEHLIRVGDKDKNGELTKAEFVEGFKPDELKVAAPQEGGRPGAGRPGNFDPAQIFNRMDRNGDGKLTKEEIPEQAADRFKPLFDALGKNEITREEYMRTLPRLAGGGQPQPGSPELFKQFDRNNDGKLTLDEVPEGMKQRFAEMLERAGKGKDGSFNAEEFARFGGRPGGLVPGQSPEEMFGRFDGNKDGKVTLSEVPEPARSMVERMLERTNKGKDGSLTLDEFRRAMADARPGQLPGRPGEPMPQGGFGMMGGPVIFRKLDRNNDGKLSKEELAKAAEIFEELDSNKDGTIDIREMFGAPPGGFGGRPGAPGTPGNPPGAGGNADAAAKPAEVKPAESTSAAAEKPKGPPAETTRRKARADGLQRFDKNKDGKVSKDEAEGRLKDNFDRADRNGDGFLDQTELREAFERLGRKKKTDRKSDA